MKPRILQRVVQALKIRIPWLAWGLFPAVLSGFVLCMGTRARADDSGPSPSGKALPLTGTLRLADLIDQAYAHNPSIEQAR
jgi:hypothetical protein